MPTVMPCVVRTPLRSGNCYCVKVFTVKRCESRLNRILIKQCARLFWSSSPITVTDKEVISDSEGTSFLSHTLHRLEDFLETATAKMPKTCSAKTFLNGNKSLMFSSLGLPKVMVAVPVVVCVFSPAILFKKLSSPCQGLVCCLPCVHNLSHGWEHGKCGDHIRSLQQCMKEVIGY